MGRIKVRAILEAKFSGMTSNAIAKSRKQSKHSIKDVLETAARLGITGTDRIPDKDDEELYRMFFPDRYDPSQVYAPVDWEYVHKELNRTGVTLRLLHEEYRKKCAEQGLVAASYSKYARDYRAFVGRRGYASHIEHKAGDRIEVDWSGPTMRYTDPESGRSVTVYLFVADLVCSRYAFVEPTLDMREQTWLQCHVDMWRYYGGVSRILVCDNLKTGVSAHPREGEVVLTRDYQMIAEHYGTAVMPCDVRSPRQKNSVENTVRGVALAIIARLRDNRFTSFGALKAAVARQLEELNERPFQNRAGSRRLDFEENERPYLRPLPSAPFEIGLWFYGRKVQPNCHIAFQRNWYSVPFAYQGCTVDVKATPDEICIYHGLQLVKRHIRFARGITGRYRTDEGDMPKGKGFAEWDADRIRRWASGFGPATSTVVERILSSRMIVEQTFMPAIAVLRLGDRYGKERVEKASEAALARFGSPRYPHLRSMLAAGQEDGSGTRRQAPRARLKGEDYFKKFGGAL